MADPKEEKPENSEETQNKDPEKEMPKEEKTEDSEQEKKDSKDDQKSEEKPSGSPGEKVKIFSGAIKDRKFVSLFITTSFIAFILEFIYIHYFIGIELVGLALSLASSFTGATFIGLALLSSTIFKFKPKLAKYIKVRRNLGVVGFVFILFHFISMYSIKSSELFTSLNPFENPVIYGLLAFPIFAVMFATSTDWAVAKLGSSWKTIHRLVYFGFLLSVFHILMVNPTNLFNISGYILLGVAFAAIGGELILFFEAILFNKSTPRGVFIGMLAILIYLFIIYISYFQPSG